MIHGKKFITANISHGYLRWLCIVCFFLKIFIFISYAHADTGHDQALSIGNFALPSSQQPGAFLSFGQNTLEKDKTQLYLFLDDFAGHQQRIIDAMPGIVYGVSNNLSIFLNVPFAVSYQQKSNLSSGLGDVLLQLEYVLYSKQTNYYSDTATIVANTSFPTGSSTKNPPTGFGAQAFFLGGTFSRLYVDWLIFFSPGILAPSSHNGTKVGESFLYQFGLGKNISYATSQYIFAWLIELNGTLSQKNRLDGKIDPNSGGNIIYATPSLWFSTEHLIFQVGVGWTVAQNLNGNQPANTYLIAANLGWTF